MSLLGYTAALFVSALVSGCLAAYAWSQRRARGSLELACLALAVTIWATCTAFESLATTASGKLLWAGISYVGGATVAPLCLLFVWSFLGRNPLGRATGVLFIVPALTATLANTNNFHHLMYERVSLVETWAGVQGRFDHGPWYAVHTVHSYALVTASLLWLWWSTRHAGWIRVMQSRWIMAAFLVPFVGNLLYVLTPGAVSGIDLAPIGSTVSGMALATTIYRHRLMRLGSLARSVLFEQMEDAVIFLDAELSITDFNSAARAMLGLSRADLGHTVGQLRGVGPVLDSLSRTGEDGETEIEVDDGRWLRVRWSGLGDAGGRSFGRMVVVQDVTKYRHAEEQRLEMERQLQHTQKLESLGVLAGGIAHDFNNLLTIILGRADLALLESPQSTVTHESLADIVTASRRAADLCRQMLAYSGRGQFVVGDVSLNDLVREMTGLIQTSISKRVRLTLDLGSDLPLVRADATQLRQVILNLITNASEALMDRSGTIEVRSRSAFVAQAELRELALGAQLPDGEYVSLEVQDSGSGMAPEVVERMFEPFFTTKFTGRGLGLSAVLGIVRGHQGAVGVESHSGSGTRVRVLLPALTAASPATTGSPEAASDGAAAVRRSTVLLVDDEEMVRQVGVAMLQRLGHNVMVASNGDEALALYRAAPGEVSCVILDLTMPGPDSAAVLHAMRSINPHLPVIVTSGFAEPDAAAGVADDVAFLQKPYELPRLRDILRGVLPSAEAERAVRVR